MSCVLLRLESLLRGCLRLRVLSFGLALPLGLCLLLAFLHGCKSKPAAREVVLYCSADQDVAEPIVAAFERQTGIHVLARYDTEAGKTVGLIQKLRAEAAAPVADVFWSNDTFHTIRLAREGALVDWKPTDSALAAWPRNYRDANGRWWGFALRVRVIGYNTNRVTEDQAPRRLEDLLDPKWKDRIVLADPQFGTTGGDIASWFAHYGPGKAREILEGLKANSARLVDGNSTALRLVANGQADVCFTDSDDVYAGQRNGWPVAMHYLDQNGEGALAIPNTVGIVRGGPHPEAARSLADFLLSPQVEEMLANSDAHNTPVHPALAERFAKYAIPKPLNIDYEKIADQLPTAISTAEEVFHGH